MKSVFFILVLALSFSVFAQEDMKKEYPNDPVFVIKTTMGNIYLELFEKEAPKTVANFIGLAEGTKEYTDPKTKKKVKGNYYDGLIFHRVIKKFMIQGGCPMGNGMGGPGYKFEDEISAKALGLDKMKAFDAKFRPNRLLGIRSQQQMAQLLRPTYQELGIRSRADLQKKIEELKKKIKALTFKDAFERFGYTYDDTLKSHHPKRGVIAMANSGPKTNGSQFFINIIDTPWLTGKHTVFGKVIKGMDIVDKISNAKVGGGARPVTEIKIISVRRYKSK